LIIFDPNADNFLQVLAGKDINWKTVRAFLIFGTLVTGKICIKCIKTSAIAADIFYVLKTAL
jgi:hypothetical protein